MSRNIYRSLFWYGCRFSKSCGSYWIPPSDINVIAELARLLSTLHRVLSGRRGFSIICIRYIVMNRKMGFLMILNYRTSLCFRRHLDDAITFEGWRPYCGGGRENAWYHTHYLIRLLVYNVVLSEVSITCSLNVSIFSRVTQIYFKYMLCSNSPF